ncbi:TIGR00730 family Rossman fold protein [Agarilytica rhodophyticola]|uniref:LOG family protein n=1 Tax=Agarilytica rhodophyticola TaxID=1737490 RepID=UPI000B34552E|nr:TIGR00730 family Rossman fold protein [Agarilytica rhodophyticola]
MKKICVYCGSSSGGKPEYLDAANILAEEFIKRGIGLVYGGASVGLMGKIADKVLAFGGEVIGVIPHALAEKELSHPGLTELKVVNSMHERKTIMADIADGFIALPGGLGTLEEIFEVLTWAQLGFHSKPCALFNAAGYYDKLAAFLDHAVREEFVKDIHRNSLLVDNDAQSLLDRMFEYQAPSDHKWIGRDET